MKTVSNAGRNILEIVLLLAVGLLVMVDPFKGVPTGLQASTLAGLAGLTVIRGIEERLFGVGMMTWRRYLLRLAAFSGWIVLFLAIISRFGEDRANSVFLVLVGIYIGMWMYSFRKDASVGTQTNCDRDS